LGCLRRFFERKLFCNVPEEADAMAAWNVVSGQTEVLVAEGRLDDELRASGFSVDMKNDLELYYFNAGPTGPMPTLGDDDEEEEEEGDLEEELEEEQESKSQGSNGEEDAQNLQSSPDNELESLADDTTTAEVIIDNQEMESLSHAELAARAKDRVRKQIQGERRKTQRSGAFRKRNNNKKFDGTGRRVYTSEGGL
jgi:hypothetical protein